MLSLSVTKMGLFWWIWIDDKGIATVSQGVHTKKSTLTLEFLKVRSVFSVFHVLKKAYHLRVRNSVWDVFALWAFWMMKRDKSLNW